jgi:uncharacterized protein YbjT (DUF2867 family)
MAMSGTHKWNSSSYLLSNVPFPEYSLAVKLNKISDFKYSMGSESNRGNILITGATGNVGFEIVKQLPADRNTRLRAAVRSINNASKVIGQRAELVEMDYSKAESISKAINGIDKLFLLTPFEPSMVELSSNLISEAEKTGTVKHIVKQSVMGADAEPGIIASRLQE